ncbi:MAG: oligopeptide/dipeptide ABC transporter ATP-binding protein [Wenzhouxiangella sp.]
MYCGQGVEEGPTGTLFANPSHPYTAGLLASIPSLQAQPSRRLPAIMGQVPEPGAMPTGCRFAPRCPHARARCHLDAPPLISTSGGQHACFFPLGSPVRQLTTEPGQS